MIKGTAKTTEKTTAAKKPAAEKAVKAAPAAEKIPPKVLNGFVTFVDI